MQTLHRTCHRPVWCRTAPVLPSPPALQARRRGALRFSGDRRVGSPRGRRSGQGAVADGLPAAIARAAAEAGGDVQLIGKVGEGAAGDAVLLAVAADGVGHVAVLRDVEAVIVEPDETAPELGDAPIDTAAGLDGSMDDVEPTTERPSVPAGPALDAADLTLALQYLPDYRVVVIAEELDAAAVAAVVGAARWAGAALVVATPGASSVPELPEDATVLQAPAQDAEGAFAMLVGRYAAALDGGREPADAFAGASSGTGWSAVAD